MAADTFSDCTGSADLAAASSARAGTATNAMLDINMTEPGWGPWCMAVLCSWGSAIRRL